jgi:hypothetical protein
MQLERHAGLFCINNTKGPKMNICKYCNSNAIYPPKTKWGGWCCKDRFYDCPGYKKKLSENSYSWNKGLTKETNEKLAELATKAKGVRVGTQQRQKN